MALRNCAATVALLTMILTPASAWALALTCSDLGEYARAAGTLEGLSTCDMSVAQARRIIASQGGANAGYEQVAPAPRVYHRHHRLRRLQEE